MVECLHGEAASQSLNYLKITHTFSWLVLRGAVCRTAGQRTACSNTWSKRPLFSFLLGGHRSLCPCYRRDRTCRVLWMQFHQRRPLPLLVVVRPGRPHPVRGKPADDRSHRFVHRTHAHGGVPSLSADQTLRRVAIRSVPFHSR